MQRLPTARVRIHTQQRTGDATVVWPQYTAPAPQKLGEQPLTLLRLFRRPCSAEMSRPRGPCGLEAKSFGIAASASASVSLMAAASISASWHLASASALASCPAGLVNITAAQSVCVCVCVCVCVMYSLAAAWRAWSEDNCVSVTDSVASRSSARKRPPTPSTAGARPQQRTKVMCRKLEWITQ